MAEKNIIADLLLQGRSDGVSTQTKRELLRLGLISAPGLEEKKVSPETAKYSEKGRTQAEEYTRVMGEEAAKKRKAAQDAQRVMLLIKMQRAQQELKKGLPEDVVKGAMDFAQQEAFSNR